MFCSVLCHRWDEAECDAFNCSYNGIIRIKVPRRFTGLDESFVRKPALRACFFTVWNSHSSLYFKKTSLFWQKGLKKKLKAWLLWNAESVKSDNCFCIYLYAFNKSLNNKSPHASSVFRQSVIYNAAKSCLYSYGP